MKGQLSWMLLCFSHKKKHVFWLTLVCQSGGWSPIQNIFQWSWNGYTKLKISINTVLIVLKCCSGYSLKVIFNLLYYYNKQWYCTLRHTGDLSKIGLVRPKKCYFHNLCNVVTFQSLQKCPYRECSFGLVFIGSTCVLSLLWGDWVIFSDWALCQWLCHCTACDPLGSLLVPPPLAREREWSQLLWLLGTVRCGCLLVPPPWSAGRSFLSFCGCCDVKWG